MKFRKVTATKYVGTDDYSLHQSRDGRFSICKDNAVTSWGTGFQTVRSAELFLNNRDYLKATTETLPINEDDLEFVEQVYGMSMQRTGRGNEYKLISDPFTITVPDDFEESHEVKLEAEATEDIDEVIDDVSKLLLNLDSLESEVLASAVFRGVELRGESLDYIFAKKSPRRSTRDIVKDLIRVKSSNVWAYGVEIKDGDAKSGDVYVQFKGKNGGPEDVYRYYDVPLSLWRKFISTPSKGAFLWKYLRNKFAYSKLTGDKRGKLPNAVN